MGLHEQPFSEVLNRLLGRGIYLGIRVSLYQDSWLDVGLVAWAMRERFTDRDIEEAVSTEALTVEFEMARIKECSGGALCLSSGSDRAFGHSLRSSLVSFLGQGGRE